MRRAIAAILTAVAVLLCSCELSYERRNPAPEVGTVRILVYGNDYATNPDVYRGASKVGKASSLQGTVNDAVQIGYALTSLARQAKMDFACTYIIGSGDMGTISADIAAFDPTASVIADTTEHRFVQVLEELGLQAQPNDMTFVFYAGHGDGMNTKASYESEVSSMTYLVLSDENPSRAVCYSVEQFLDTVDAIPGTKIVLGDFCHSGALVRKGNVSIGTHEYEEIGIRSLFSKYHSDVQENPSTFCLSAAGYCEKSYESRLDPYQHGYFTKALLSAFGWNEESRELGSIKVLDAKSRLTLLNLANYVILNDGKAAQTPMVSGGSNDIVIFQF